MDSVKSKSKFAVDLNRKRIPPGKLEQ